MNDYSILIEIKRLLKILVCICVGIAGLLIIISLKLVPNYEFNSLIVSLSTYIITYCIVCYFDFKSGNYDNIEAIDRKDNNYDN